MTIAIWCLLVAGILPLIAVGVAKAAGGAYDNNDPRGRAASYTGMAKRAHAAHQNGFESFPFFAAAVLVAELKGAPQGLVAGLAVAYVVARIGYTVTYILDMATVRSLLWSAGFFASVALLVSPLWR
ncbi:MAG: MAPEG family protein [Beijerinckiaceae bacterium]